MPGVSGLGQVSKKGTELYNALPEEEKATWTAKYDEERRSYAEWAATDEGKATLRAKKRVAKAKKFARAARKGKAAKAAPKRGPGAAKRQAPRPRKALTPEERAKRIE